MALAQYGRADPESVEDARPEILDDDIRLLRKQTPSSSRSLPGSPKIQSGAESLLRLTLK